PRRRCPCGHPDLVGGGRRRALPALGVRPGLVVVPPRPGRPPRRVRDGGRPPRRAGPRRGPRAAPRVRAGHRRARGRPRPATGRRGAAAQVRRCPAVVARRDAQRGGRRLHAAGRPARVLLTTRPADAGPEARMGDRRGMVQLEIAVQDPAGAYAAREAGADRVELCSALGVGGLTPSVAMVEAVVAVGLPVHVLVRPRAGGFRYSATEVSLMVRDIEAIVDAGAAGVVVGALTAADELDRHALDALRDAAE